MKDQKIILRMTSTQVQEDGQEISAKLTATGTLQRDEQGAVIRYEENSEGLNGHVTMELRGDTVLLVREGDAQMRPKESSTGTRSELDIRASRIEIARSG